MTDDTLYVNTKHIHTIDEVDTNREMDDANNDLETIEGQQDVDKPADSNLFPGLMNSVPFNQRQAVSAILRQRQAHRIRSKSMVHYDMAVKKEGENSFEYQVWVNKYQFNVSILWSKFRLFDLNIKCKHGYLI